MLGLPFPLLLRLRQIPRHSFGDGLLDRSRRDRLVRAGLRGQADVEVDDFVKERFALGSAAAFRARDRKRVSTSFTAGIFRILPFAPLPLPSASLRSLPRLPAVALFRRSDAAR